MSAHPDLDLADQLDWEADLIDSAGQRHRPHADLMRAAAARLRALHERDTPFVTKQEYVRVLDERDDARRQMQSLTEDYVAMEARAIAAERERDELRRELDARTDPELAARLYRWANGQGRGLVEDLRGAARLLGGGE